MLKHGLDPSHPLVRWLAEQAIAADLFHATAAAARQGAAASPAASPPVRALLAYARRDRHAPADFAIEAVGPAGGPIRLPLPEPVNQAIQLPLDGNVAELAAFHRLIADPATEIFLL